MKFERNCSFRFRQHFTGACVACVAIGIQLVLLAAKSSGEVVVWAPRVQVTHVDAATDSVVETNVRGLQFQRNGSTGLHAAIAISKAPGLTMAARKTANGYHLAVDGDLDWQEAWDESAIYTFDDDPESPTETVSTDQRMVVDANNNVHVVYEDWSGGTAPVEPDSIGIYRSGFAGYKTNSNLTRWSSDHEAWCVGYVGSTSGCSEISPNFFLSGDTLVTITSGTGAPCTDHPGKRPIRKRGLSDPDSAWTDAFYIGGAGGGWTFGEGAPIVVDDFDILHVIARQTTIAGSDTTRRILHVWGEQVAPPGEMTTERDTLDVMSLNGAPVTEDGLPWAEPGAVLLRSSSTFLDVAWNHVNGNNSRALFTRIPLDDPENFSIGGRLMAASS